MDDLIDRLEQAPEGSRLLDNEIWWRLFRRGFDPSIVDYFTITVPEMAVFHNGGGGGGAMAPHYTASIDAALTLYKKRPEMVSTDPLKACVEALRQWS